MDSEFYEIPEMTSEVVNKTIDPGDGLRGRDERLPGGGVQRHHDGHRPNWGWTDKFIFAVRVQEITDRLITNHMPESTLDAGLPSSVGTCLHARTRRPSKRIPLLQLRRRHASM
jgi:S-adenosylmethionine:tRNA-ribosyltransferase-isomerase (queuine synthetase)